MTLGDALQLSKIVAGTAIAWCVPPRYWRKVASAAGGISQADQCWPVYNAILGQKYTKAEIARIRERRHTYSRELKFQILGLAGPWRAWRPDIRLNGEVNLQDALKGGRGAILWVLETTFSTLITKMALHRAGYYACQLSRPGHGFSSTPFGIRFLNPIWTRVEDRFIAERVVIYGETAAEALTVLRKRLAANGIVIITLAPQAHKFAEVPFFHTQIQLPTGPGKLALTSSAALLPVFSFANHNGGFDVSIDAPVYPADGSIATVENIIAAYAKRMEQFVSEHPDQWMGWDWLARRMRVGSPRQDDS